MPRSSLHSVRKASYDVRSVGSDGTPFWIYYQSVYWTCSCCCVYIFIICRNTHQQMFWLDGNRGHHKTPESGEATLDGHRRTHHQSDQHHHGCSRVQSQLHLTGSGQGIHSIPLKMVGTHNKKLDNKVGWCYPTLLINRWSHHLSYFYFFPRSFLSFPPRYWTSYAPQSCLHLTWPRWRDEMKIPSRPIWSAPSCWLVSFSFPSPTPLDINLMQQHLDSSRAVPETCTGP